MYCNSNTHKILIVLIPRDIQNIPDIPTLELSSLLYLVFLLLSFTLYCLLFSSVRRYS